MDSSSVESPTIESPAVDLPDARLPKPDPFMLPIHTYAGSRLVHGRAGPGGPGIPVTKHRPAILGLFMFSPISNEIWRDALAGDNPWAAWYLQRLRLMLEKAQTTLEQRFTAIESPLSTLGFDIETFPLEAPIDQPEVRLSTPAALAVADLIIDIDLLGAAMLFLRKERMMTKALFDEESSMLGHLGRRVMATFTGYKSIAVTRADVRTGTHAEVLRATKLMNAVPEKMLDLPRGHAWSGPIVLDRHDPVPGDRSLREPKSAPDPVQTAG